MKFSVKAPFALALAAGFALTLGACTKKEEVPPPPTAPAVTAPVDPAAGAPTAPVDPNAAPPAGAPAVPPAGH